MSKLEKKQTPQSYNFSLEKSLKIIEVLSTSVNNEYLSIVRIKELTGYDNATIYRILNTFYVNGYVEKNEYSKYKLGYKFITIAGKMLSEFSLREKVRPYLVKLTEKTGLLSFLSIVYDENVVLIDKVNTNASLQVSLEIGTVFPLNSSATGKLYLSDLGEDKVRELYKHKTLESVTSHSITDIDKLIKELNFIREAGYSYSGEESHLNRISLSTSIYDINNEFTAGIGVSAFRSNLNEEEKKRAVDLLKYYSKEISSRII